MSGVSRLVTRGLVFPSGRSYLASLGVREGEGEVARVKKKLRGCSMTKAGGRDDEARREPDPIT